MISIIKLTNCIISHIFQYILYNLLYSLFISYILIFILFLILYWDVLAVYFNSSDFGLFLTISGLLTDYFLCCFLENYNIENNIYNTYRLGRFTFGSNFQNRARQVVVSLHSHKVKPKPTPILLTLNPILISILSKFLCSIPHFETNPPY
jgi:hypothetical protein